MYLQNVNVCALERTKANIPHVQHKTPSPTSYQDPVTVELPLAEASQLLRGGVLTGKELAVHGLTVEFFFEHVSLLSVRDRPGMRRNWPTDPTSLEPQLKSSDTLNYTPDTKP